MESQVKYVPRRSKGAWGGGVLNQYGISGKIYTLTINREAGCAEPV